MDSNVRPASRGMAAMALATASAVMLAFCTPCATLAYASDASSQETGASASSAEGDSSSTGSAPSTALSSLAKAKVSGAKHTISVGTAKSSVVSVKDDSVMEGAAVCLAANKKLGGQAWTFKSAGSGCYYIVNVKSGRALTATKNGEGAWRKLVVKKLKKASSQKWSLRKYSKGYCLAAEVGSNLCLTMGGKLSKGRRLSLSKWNGLSSQIVKIGSSTYKTKRTTILNSINSASKSAAITGFGGGDFNAHSAAGKKVSAALKALKKSSGTCAFVMVDLNTGAGISSSASKPVYGASTIKGPYMTALCKYRASSITGSARGHMYQVMSWSSNTDYTALRHRFGSSPMSAFKSYTDVTEISSGRTWVTYSPRTLAKFWTGTYWYLFKDTNKRSSLLKKYGRYGASSFIKRALDGKKGYTTYTKAGWGTFSRSGNIYNDAGIVYVKGHPYLLAVMSKAYNHPSQLRTLVRALDAYHSYMLE